MYALLNEQTIDKVINYNRPKISKWPRHLSSGISQLHPIQIYSTEPQQGVSFNANKNYKSKSKCNVAIHPNHPTGDIHQISQTLISCSTAFSNVQILYVHSAFIHAKAVLKTLSSSYRIDSSLLSTTIQMAIKFHLFFAECGFTWNTYTHIHTQLVYETCFNQSNSYTFFHRAHCIVVRALVGRINGLAGDCELHYNRTEIFATIHPSMVQHIHSANASRSFNITFSVRLCSTGQSPNWIYRTKNHTTVRHIKQTLE